jgi:hypothetical protein
MSVEVAGKSDPVVTIRDRDGRTLHRLDPPERLTIVAKRMMQALPRPSGHGVAPPQPAPSDATRELPDGCEVQPVCRTQHGECHRPVCFRCRAVCRSAPDKKSPALGPWDVAGPNCSGNFTARPVRRARLSLAEQSKYASLLAGLWRLQPSGRHRHYGSVIHAPSAHERCGSGSCWP